ncbi:MULTISPECIES: hypothetical protein [Nocardia]|uniref:Uncharacterized protein n=4 Tax=Nocardia TaxID=1817 RepID=A0A7G1KJ46_9NOCA|nr:MULTISPECIES: hypothetical protein [Nocardia]MBF6295504.1 hypothetical protein [Nocardia farcinica]MBF6362347.1 hypothetical protein [Nocardia farcinica]MBF6381889.1 hypothetical protein [Nocardia farcinica]MBF6445603.1 hypothetical protein [Nocardia farcinica]MBF6451915.1 hypothetical protein [Nocardia cyriacigeorgica]
MTDDLPQRNPGATLPTHFERLGEALATVIVARDESGGPLARSFSCDEATMRRVAEQLPLWTGDPAAD